MIVQTKTIVERMFGINQLTLQEDLYVKIAETYLS